MNSSSFTHDADQSVERRGYSVDEVAKMYGLSRNKVYDALALGHLHSFKIGKRRIIPTSALKAWEGGAA